MKSVHCFEIVSSLSGLSLDVHLSVTNILPFILQESCVSISVGYAFLVSARDYSQDCWSSWYGWSSLCWGTAWLSIRVISWSQEFSVKLFGYLAEWSKFTARGGRRCTVRMQQNWTYWETSGKEPECFEPSIIFNPENHGSFLYLCEAWQNFYRCIVQSLLVIFIWCVLLDIDY